jgi:cell division septation protein DedD
MVKETEHETEILLGNKQLLGIFFVVAVLIGVAFAGGYMIGHGPGKKSVTPTTTTAPSEAATPASTPSTGVGETHSVGADISTGEGKQAEDAAPDVAPPAKEATPATTREKVNASFNTRSRRHQEQTSPSEEIKPTPEPATGTFTPQPGQMFLQVAAVGRDEAEAVADVLHKKGFRAHAIQKPGNPKIYRVLIGPVRDTGDLSSTRDSLRHAGFREVIVQRY